MKTLRLVELLLHCLCGIFAVMYFCGEAFLSKAEINTPLLKLYTLLFVGIWFIEEMQIVLSLSRIFNAGHQYFFHHYLLNKSTALNHMFYILFIEAKNL